MNKDNLTYSSGVKKTPSNYSNIIHNIIVGLTVSFVALSLGAALGILSGRSAFAGMFSAGIIAIITSLFGGTRIQCSGPTAPMSAITAIVIAFAFEHNFPNIEQYNPDHFINLVIILSGLVTILMGIFRLGGLIKIIPNVVISGFMSGIAILIFVGQVKYLFELEEGKATIGGLMSYNVIITLVTLAIMLFLPKLLRKILPKLAHFIPSTLLAIVGVSFAAYIFNLQVGYISINLELNNWPDFKEFVGQQVPQNLSYNYVIAALPFALQLAVLCYFDSLLTSRVIDKMKSSHTKPNQELAAQGVANSVVAFIGGIPGAQATIRSVLMVKEGATLRLAGICTGIFVLIEMLCFYDLMNYIPKAVFVAILFKVSYDVFDFDPLIAYVKRRKNEINDDDIFANINKTDIAIIAITAIVTACYDLNVAVIGCTILFYILKLYRKRSISTST